MKFKTLFYNPKLVKGVLEGVMSVREAIRLERDL